MKLTFSILALFVSVSFSTAAAAEDEDFSARVAPEEEAAESIVVASQKSADELRRDFWRAERDFYSIYNTLNDDGRYDVRCTKEAPTGSVLKIQMCRPKFLDKAFREGRIINSEHLDPNSEIAGKIATFQQNLKTLVADNPDLQTAATTLNLAHARLDAVQE